jgi:hypothetical protein
MVKEQQLFTESDSSLLRQEEIATGHLHEEN